ncbi:MAG: glutamyl-tRNA amidotransferase [Planctomycetes bacterium DG_58]|nr:MAG: glutamyl-tRNA amidotransferase [Planctomycetes bacterium DG_58]
MKPVHHQSACELLQAQEAGELSAVRITEACLDRIGKLDGSVHAFISVRPERALEQAKSIDERRRRGEKLGPLAGLPVALKDNMCTVGWETTCASKILKNFKPPYDATVVEKLRAADAVLIGKTNMDEFAFGSSTESSAFFATRNPWDLGRVPGGSSGGSAAALSAGFVPLAVGSSTGGSVRQPAGFCGVMGLKPTYGRVSRYGLIAFGSSLDQISPLARDVRDLALLTTVVAGYDSRDSTCINAPAPDYVAELDEPCDGMKLGVPAEYFAEGLDADVAERITEAIATLDELGFEIVEIRLPHTKYAIASYYVVATAEASSNLARFDGVHYGHRTAEKTGLVELYSLSREEGFGDEAKRRIMLGTYALSSGYYDAYYLKALKVRRRMKEDFDRAWQTVDAVLCPTSPTTAFRIGELVDDPLAMYLSDIFTVPANMVGIPGISMPCGFDGSGLPVGLQVMAPNLEESRLFRVARAFQSHTDFHLSRPDL